MDDRDRLRCFVQRDLAGAAVTLSFFMQGDINDTVSSSRTYRVRIKEQCQIRGRDRILKRRNCKKPPSHTTYTPISRNCAFVRISRHLFLLSRATQTT